MSRTLSGVGTGTITLSNISGVDIGEDDDDSGNDDILNIHKIATADTLTPEGDFDVWSWGTGELQVGVSSDREDFYSISAGDPVVNFVNP